MTGQIKIGKLKIGGGAPIVIQSMAKTDTRDVRSTVRQIKELERSGCELVRVAVKDLEAAQAIKKIKKRIKIPLAADIHFDYRLAIASIENGADKIRLNPGNIYKEDEIKIIAKLAKKRKIPIRAGINSGSVKCKVLSVKSKNLADLMVTSALDYIKVLEKYKFYDIIVSLKASDVLTTIDAYRKFSKVSRYPLHLGVTAVGPISTGLVKSSIGIGVLLSEGIGDTIRVSLTGDPCSEVRAAKNILQSLNLRYFGPEIISCPTCGRCQVNLQKIVDEILFTVDRLPCTVSDGKRSTVNGTRNRNLKIAVMGCEVNGPGEAKDADIGVAFSKGAGVLFKQGKVIKRVREKDAVRELSDIIDQI